MKIEHCSVCGQYHSDNECEATDQTIELTKFEKIRRQRNFDSSPPKEKNKGFRRPPADKMIKWEYTK